MSQRDDHWEAEDEDVVRRLRDGKPRISAFELDRVKTAVMARVRPSSSRRTSPRFGLLVAMLTVGAMAAGTAGTIAAGSTSLSGGTGAAQSQYRPPKCNPAHEECKCPDNSVRTGRDACTCPAGETFAAGGNYCACPDGASLTDGQCVTCPDREVLVDGKCVRHRDESPPPSTPTTVGSAPTTVGSTPATVDSTPATVDSTPATVDSTPATVGSTHATVGATHSRTRRTTRSRKRRLAHGRKHS